MSDRRWKIHVVVGLVLGFVATTPTATAGESSALFEGESHLDRHRLMRAVEERNPTVLSARSALEAALARPSQVRSLSDPMVSYTFAPQSVVSDVVPYGQVLRFSQHVPYPGKRRIRPKFMAVATTMIALVPVMLSTGAGADVMKRIAAPMVGGLASSFLLQLTIYPAVFAIWKQRERRSA